MALGISYNKLWKVLIDKKMSKADLRRSADISSSTLTKLRKDEDVSMVVLQKICECLDCNIGDICDFVKVDKTEVDAQ